MNLASSISAYNRARKYGCFFKELNPRWDAKILDVGFTNREYREADNFLEKNYYSQSYITALGLSAHGSDLFAKRYPGVRVKLYDGKIFPFADKEFDIGWSNAVIEHVGDEERQLLFLRELNRTCKSVYMTTSNRCFPVELHTWLPLLHYLPKKTFDAIISRTPLRWAAGDYMHLLTRRKIKKLMRLAGISNYRIISNHMFGFTMDFSIIISNAYK
ncbi:MAG: class I SAM-dependent methyltransferase [Tannerellaceae bacterium]|jgi:hypothetical protein|nr:class I SAM-dependent methyltransferase [Tannerellaceae bacterium]